MTSSLKEIESSALQLNKEERTELVKSLIESLEDDQSILYEKEWMNVVREKKERHETGKSTTISWNEIKKELKNKTEP